MVNVLICSGCVGVLVYRNKVLVVVIGRFIVWNFFGIYSSFGF